MLSEYFSTLTPNYSPDTTRIPLGSRNTNGDPKSCEMTYEEQVVTWEAEDHPILRGRIMRGV